MNDFAWHPRFHTAALRGMARLTLEQRGAYDLILDLIYERGAPIEDDDTWLSRQANTTVQRWRRVKIELAELGKLTIAGGLISNPRATLELDHMDARHMARVAAGKASGRARKQRQVINSTSRVTCEVTPQVTFDFEGDNPNENNGPGRTMQTHIQIQDINGDVAPTSTRDFPEPSSPVRAQPPAAESGGCALGPQAEQGFDGGGKSRRRAKTPDQRAAARARRAEALAALKGEGGAS